MRGLVVMSQSWQTYVAFLAAGGGLDFRDAKGRPLLLIAFEGENDDLAQGLMRRGADVTVRTTPPKIEEEDEEERHEFRETDARDYLGGLKESTVRMFFEKAPSARLDKHFAYTPPLNEAAEKGNVKVMALLLAKGADINGMCYAKTPLHCAARARFGRVAGAPRPARVEEDETALARERLRDGAPGRQVEAEAVQEEQRRAAAEGLVMERRSVGRRTARCFGIER